MALVIQENDFPEMDEDAVRASIEASLSYEARMEAHFRNGEREPLEQAADARKEIDVCGAGSDCEEGNCPCSLLDRMAPRS